MAERPVLIISGASGLIGSLLQGAAQSRYDLKMLTRNPEKAAEPGWVLWNPEKASQGDETALRTLSDTLSGSYALVNLAGVSISDGRLDEAHRARVLESRVQSTRALLLAQRQAQNPAKVWFQPSASGYYGDRGDALLTEDAAPGKAPLSAICRAWEEAAEDAGGARLVVGRLGTVLTPEAESWNKLLLPIRLFVGGPLGSGQQWFPWIEGDDLARAILFLLETPQTKGVYNLTAPEPVRQIAFVRAVASRLSRPAFVPAPAFALRLALGELADALLLASARVVPERLTQAGFQFERGTLSAALDKLLK
jgi:uncharacterized protein (TIGR01777 family)